MKKTFVFPLIITLFFAFGCGLVDRFKSNSNANANANTATPTPATTPTAAPSASPTPFDKNFLGRNLLAFGAGTIVIAQTSEAKNSDESARHLNDESSFAWKTADEAIENQSVTMELPARTTFKSFVFDTGQPTAYDGRAAKDVLIEVSDTSATDGFQTILETTLKDSSGKNGVNDQYVEVSKLTPAKYVRYTAKNNFGSPLVIYTGELYGYGDQEQRPPVANVSGTYKVPGLGGDLHLKQEGTVIIGCYPENNGVLEGTIDGRTLTLTSTENDARSKGEKTSFVAINVVNDGKTLMSTWWGWSPTPTKKSYDRLYVGDKSSDKIGNCPFMPDLDGAKDVVKDNLEKEIEAKGKAILYGINFDFNSDVIRLESFSTLDKVVAILKARPDWKMNVEGHTDNIGGDVFNQSLSERRAASVVKYLTDAGIAADRLTSAGFGLTRPLVPNNSESERAQNRRVELVKQ